MIYDGITVCTKQRLNICKDHLNDDMHLLSFHLSLDIHSDIFQGSATTMPLVFFNLLQVNDKVPINNNSQHEMFP